MEWHRIIEEHYAPAFCFAWALAGEDAAAAQLTQETFERLLPGLATGAGGDIRRALLMAMYQRFDEPAAPAAASAAPMPPEPVALPFPAVASLSADALLRSLASLPRRQRAALMLFYGLAASLHVISDVLGLPAEETVFTLSQAKTRWRELLAHARESASTGKEPRHE